jgi:hypothetical protein
MEDTSATAEPIPIEFYTAKQHAHLLKAAPPVPAAQATPRWYRETDSHFRKVTPFQVYPPELRLRQNATVKACPGIRDHLSAGFILPLWADVAITFEDGNYRWESPQPDFVIDKHDPEQYAQMPRPGFPMALKFMSPWFCRTPPGYSIRLLPCFYHFDHLWSAMPGVVNTDSVHVTHVNVLFEPPRGQIVLPQGTPLVHIIPFRRERHALGLHVASEQEMEEEAATARHFASFFHDAELYPKG